MLTPMRKLQGIVSLFTIARGRGHSADKLQKDPKYEGNGFNKIRHLCHERKQKERRENKRGRLRGFHSTDGRAK